MDLKAVAGALFIIGLLIGVGIGYLLYYGKGVQATTETTTVTKTMTETTTKTQTKLVKENYTIRLAYDPSVGLYLTDSKGMTLYIFAKDVNGSSTCYGECAKKWPVFYVDEIKPSPGLDPKDFSIITRKDGTKQVAYKGWPLYYFFKDEKPGDIKGDGVKNVWYVAKPDYTVLVGYKEGLGLYLVDSRGMTLYYFAKDVNGTPACYGACASKWPVFMPPTPPGEFVVPSILNITDFSFVQRSDGKIQVVYKGHPLYYWVNDKARGETTGHMVKNVWFVANVKGVLP
ncbi:MAG: hypothetical protein F7C38_08330 [Desulfurococcales archaeon]|nr:hypothetical protein [Desulfurococcales archaeon]